MTGGRSTEHYVVNTDEPYGELVAITVSVRHRHVTEQWFLRRVVVSLDPRGPDRAVRCFPYHDIVQARVTLRTGNGQSDARTLYVQLEMWAIDALPLEAA